MHRKNLPIGFSPQMSYELLVRICAVGFQFKLKSFICFENTLPSTKIQNGYWTHNDWHTQSNAVKVVQTFKFLVV